MKIEEERRYIHKILNDMKIDNEDKFMSAVANVIFEDNKKIKLLQYERAFNNKIIDLMLDDLDTNGYGKKALYNSYRNRTVNIMKDKYKIK